MKKYIKLIIDVCMIILMPLLFSIKNNIWHEILGLVFLLFIISHILLNFKEFKALIKNKLKLIYLILVVLCALIVITSGIFNSQYIFSFIKVSNQQIFRSVHMFAAIVLFILAAVHAGVSIKNSFWYGIKTNKSKAIAFKAIIILIMLYGVYACYAQSIWNNFTQPFTYSKAGNEINFNNDQNRPSPPNGSGQDNTANNGSSGVDSSNNSPSSNADNQNNSNSDTQNGNDVLNNDKKTPPNNNGSQRTDGKMMPQAQSINSKWYKTFIDYISIFVLFSAGAYFLAKLASKPKKTDENEKIEAS